MVDPIDISDDTFQSEVIESDVPVLVDFWADWCGPCKVVAPAVKALAGEFDGRCKVAKLDIDANPHTPTRYGVRSIPTLLIFKGGAPVDQVVGAVPKSVLKGRLEAALS